MFATCFLPVSGSMTPAPLLPLQCQFIPVSTVDFSVFTLPEPASSCPARDIQAGQPSTAPSPMGPLPVPRCQLSPAAPFPQRSVFQFHMTSLLSSKTLEPASWYLLLKSLTLKKQILISAAHIPSLRFYILIIMTTTALCFPSPGKDALIPFLPFHFSNIQFTILFFSLKITSVVLCTD